MILCICCRRFRGPCADAVGGRGHRLLGGPFADPTPPWAAGGQSMKRLVALLLLAVLVGTGALLWPRISRSPSDIAAAGQQSQVPAVPVVVATVVTKPVPVQFGTIGTVTAYATVAIKSRLDGEIMEVHLKDGQDVKAGDLLFSIDSRMIHTQLEQAQANLAHDQALLVNAQHEV